MSAFSGELLKKIIATFRGYGNIVQAKSFSIDVVRINKQGPASSTVRF